MKKAVSLILTAVFVLCSLSLCFMAFAGVKYDDVQKTRLGTTNTYYEFNASTKTLTISGSGDTPNYTSSGSGTPWYEWRDESIDKVVVEEGVTSIGNYMFYNTLAKEFVLPHSLTKLGNNAMAYTTNVTKWDLPFGLKTIGTYAFSNAKNIESINIPDTVTSIGSRAFQGCSVLRSIKIPYSVSSIGSYAFYQCTDLSEVKFQSLTSTVNIANYCFLGCNSLKSIAVPMNAAVNVCSFGYKDKNTKLAGTSMAVFNNSSAHNFAVANGISYTLIDSVPMENGVSYYNSFTDDNINKTYCYEFVADGSVNYNFYSLGNCDTNAVLKNSNGITVAENDDISNTDRNFFISASLSAGSKYYLYVNSVKSYGDYTVIVYPEKVVSFDIFGSLSFGAEEGEYSEDKSHFDITDEMIAPLILTVNFENGYSDMIYCYNGVFDNKEIGYIDTQVEMPFTCGTNLAQIKIGNVLSDFNVNITHSYDSLTIPYTADDDGYTLYTCKLCRDSYKDDFVKTPAITVSGVAYIRESSKYGNTDNIPYTHFVIKVEDREYQVDSSGHWSFNTLDDCTAVLSNEYGEDVSIQADFDGGSVDYGAVIMQGYDFNHDRVINGKDYAIYAKEMHYPYGKDYMKYFSNNLTTK